LQQTNKIHFLLFIALLLFSSCKKQDNITNFDSKNYPEEVAQIIINKCATAGCHTDASKAAAAGLSLSSWDQLFEGSHAGSPVIPYRDDQSYLMFSINPNPNLGISLSPTMPLNASPLSEDEYTTLQDWITSGAPNKDGLVKFADDPRRRKLYVTNQGCDMVSVFDAASQTLMRYIDVGSKDEMESPQQIKVSPDGKYWYTIFFAGTVIQKFNAIDDRFVAEAEMGTGNWRNLRISSDSKFAFVVNWSDNGSIAIVDLDNMQLINTYGGSSLFELPLGAYLNGANDQLYITAQHGNFIYKIDISDMDNPLVEKISLNGISPTIISWLNPHEILMTPDESKYFITCEESNEVRVFQTENDSLLNIIPTGVFPQEMALSEATPYLFVTCTEDSITYPGQLGSVQVIDYNTNTLVKTIYTGYQPQGIIVDDNEQLVYVVHRNKNSDGPMPHHVTDCEGRNGYVTIIDLNSLELLPDYKVEVAVDPYGIAVRE